MGPSGLTSRTTVQALHELHFDFDSVHQTIAAVGPSTKKAVQELTKRTVGATAF